GVKFVLDHPGVTALTLERAALRRQTRMSSLQEQYQLARDHYGPVVAATKYLVIAILCGLLVLVVVPGSYLEKLIARPGSTLAAPSPIHFLLSALAVGVVVAVLAYLLSLGVRPAMEPSAITAVAGDASAPAVGERI